MNLDEIKAILALMRDNGLSEFEIEHEGLRLRLRKDAPGSAAGVQALQATGVSPGTGTSVGPAAATPAPAPGGAVPSDAQRPAADSHTAAEIELAVVKSPIVGTFYRSPDPASPAFVNVGDRIQVGQVLCIIEAMKLMNEIEAEVSGELVKIYHDNGQPVQYGEPLFAVRPER